MADYKSIMADTHALRVTFSGSLLATTQATTHVKNTLNVHLNKTTDKNAHSSQQKPRMNGGGDCSPLKKNNSKNNNIPSPIAANVIVSGAARDGTMLVGTYDYVGKDPEYNSIYQWFRDKDEIPGANSFYYIPTEADRGSAISFGVTPISLLAEGVITMSDTVEIMSGDINKKAF